jgi:hypothetical protein
MSKFLHREYFLNEEVLFSCTRYFISGKSRFTSMAHASPMFNEKSMSYRKSFRNLHPYWESNTDFRIIKDGVQNGCINKLIALSVCISLIGTCKFFILFPASSIIIQEVPRAQHFLFSNIYSYCSVNLSGIEISSLSIRAIYSHFAMEIISLRFAQIPLFLGLLRNMILESESAYFCMISLEPSVEPSSEMINSKSVKV